MRRSIGRFLLFAVAVCGLLAFQMIPAGAQTTTASAVERAVEGLRSDPVYVDPDASSALSAEEAENLRQQIGSSDAGPTYIAVLPERARNEAGGSTAAVLTEIAEAVGRRGTYAVVVGSELRAGSTEFESGVVPEIANEAVKNNSGGGAAGVLTDFVERLDEAARGGGRTSEDSSGGGGFGVLPIALLAIGGGAVAFSFRRNKKRMEAEERRQLEEVKEVALQDLVALGDDLRALDLQVEMPSSDPRAKEEYVKALGAYETATQNLDRAKRPQDLQQVTEALADGRYSMEAAKAILEGRQLPARRAPCFFDPRHGPSVEDVTWAPDGGSPRKVPACAADAQLIAQGESPHSREITVRGERMPYWDAPGYYGPWAGGWFGGFGGYGLLQGFLLGSMFGGGWGGGWGGGFGQDMGGGFEGGDFGGGDFGDFGGGDFGGGGGFGDFGGGDFG